MSDQTKPTDIVITVSGGDDPRIREVVAHAINHGLTYVCTGVDTPLLRYSAHRADEMISNVAERPGGVSIGTYHQRDVVIRTLPDTHRPPQSNRCGDSGDAFYGSLVDAMHEGFAAFYARGSIPIAPNPADWVDWVTKPLSTVPTSVT